MIRQGKYIVITSINPPTEAVREYAKWEGWQTVVVGDRKTPEDWQCPGVTYLGWERQQELFRELAAALPGNAYCRKSLGYAYAIRHGAAAAILDCDDDNIPREGACHRVNSLVEAANRTAGERVRSEGGWLNVHPLFGGAGWPRGFPLERINDEACKAQRGQGGAPWAVTQFLVDGDPDVDAIYRLTNGNQIFFQQTRPVILDAGTFCPINSQSTLWLPEAFPLMFLPVEVSDRVTDVLRGVIATRGLWKLGYSVQFASPIAYQQRNPHNLLDDFRQEIPLYVDNFIPLPSVNEAVCSLFLRAAGLR